MKKETTQKKLRIEIALTKLQAAYASQLAAHFKDVRKTYLEKMINKFLDKMKLKVKPVKQSKIFNTKSETPITEKRRFRKQN